MATQILKTVAGNTAPALVITAQRAGVAVDVTGTTVKLYITKDGVQTNTGHETCSLTTPASGIVSYTRQSGDIPTKGTYICDLKIDYGAGSTEILYDQLKIKARAPAV